MYPVTGETGRQGSMHPVTGESREGLTGRGIPAGLCDQRRTSRLSPFGGEREHPGAAAGELLVCTFAKCWSGATRTPLLHCSATLRCYTHAATTQKRDRMLQLHL